ncbi:UNVERIFIED_CONTAM: X-ray repair cross-complementing protein 6 [Siphonaria sp. JEL0065]|nr:X-ray repair cross-complementing protein 6 [Siphonaria sp. JEL0065]
MSSWQNRDEEPEEEEELESDERKQIVEQLRDCLVYLIDASPPMHVALDESGTTGFQACVAAAAAQYRSRIINDHRDRVGIVLFGAAKPLNALGFAGIHVLQDLDEPSAARINQLEKLAEAFSSFNEDIGSTNLYTLHEALWTVNQIFSKSAKKNDHKRVFIMTNTSQPHAGNTDLERLAITRAKDLRDTDAVVYLFGLDLEGAPFDFDAFYKDNIVISGDDASFQSLDDDRLEQEEETRYFNASGGLESLTQRVEQKVFKKRTTFSCTMILGDGLEFGIRGYNLISEVKPSSYTYLVAATNEEAAIQTSYICKTTSQQLALTDMDAYYPYGGEKAIFSKEEVAQIKCFGEPAVRLIGFKSLSVITKKPYYNLKHAVFIVPDESKYIGSSSVFIQFLARVHAKGKVAICSYMPKKSSSPRVVALLPQMEEYDDKGNVVKPSGFNMIHIPFSDDLRKPDAPKFSIKDNHHTQPNDEVIQRRIAKLVPQLRDAIPEGLDDEDEPKPTAAKRKAAASGSPAAPKRVKVTAVGENGDIDEEVIKKAYQGGTLQKLTVAILSAYLKQKNQVPAKKKDGLVAQVETFLEAKQE